MRCVSVSDARTRRGHDSTLDGAGVTVGVAVAAEEGVAPVCVGIADGLALAPWPGVDCGVAVVGGLVVGVDVAQATSRIGKRATTRCRRPRRWCRFTSSRR